MTSLRSYRPARYSVLRKGSAECGFTRSDTRILVVRRISDQHPFVEKQFDRNRTNFSFEEEKNLLSSFWKNRNRSPYIQNMHGSFLDPQGTRASIFLRYCDQGSLDDLVKKHILASLPIPEAFMWKIFLSMARAIVFLHAGEKPILHRNLCAKNVLFITGEQEPDIRVAGFEYAIQGDSSEFDAGSSSKARDLPPKPTYQPPEHPHYYAKSDVWQVANCVSRVYKNTKGDRQESKVFHDAIQCCMATEYMKRPLSVALEQMISHAWKFEIDMRLSGRILFPNEYTLHK